MRTALSSKSFWDDEWQKEKRVNPYEFVFAEILKRYLPQEGTYLEIGCAPGTTMIFFNKIFGYRVSGVDFSSAEIIKNNLENYDIMDFDIYNQEFSGLQLDKKFTVVASFGFIEHFTDYDQIIKKHIDLVEDEGYLVLELPNLRYLNYFLYRIFNPELLKIHNLEVMSPKVLKKVVKTYGGFDIKYCDYFLSSFLFFNENNAEIASRPWLKGIFSTLKTILEKLKLKHIPNRFFSPYIILIARKSSAK